MSKGQRKTKWSSGKKLIFRNEYKRRKLIYIGSVLLNTHVLTEVNNSLHKHFLIDSEKSKNIFVNIFLQQDWEPNSSNCLEGEFLVDVLTCLPV